MLLTIPELLEQASINVKKMPADLAIPLCNKIQGLLIDVREPNESIEKPVTGAINIPRGVLETRMLQLYPDADKAIFLHCASSARATLAAEQLTRIGYKNITVISCGIDTIMKTLG